MIPIALNFDGLGKLSAYSFGPPEIKRGEKAKLKVRMEVTPELIRHYHLFIHLYSPSNEFLGSFGGPFPVEPRTGEVEMVFSVDTSKASAGGSGQLAIGIWNPETGNRLKMIKQ